MGRVRFLFTITGFWLRRMALALRMAAWEARRAQVTHPTSCAPHPRMPPRWATFPLPQSAVTGGPSFTALARLPGSLLCSRLHHLASALQPPLTIRKSGRYLFFRIMCRMLLRVARAFLLMVVRT